MRSVYFILASLSLAFLGCKKETVKNVSENDATSCVCLKENIGATLANQVPCYGFLTMTTYMDMTKEKQFSYITTNAFFSSISDRYASGNSIVTVDSVCLNQQELKSIKDANGDHIYYQNDHTSLPSQQEWSIYGTNGIPSFTCNADVKDPVADFSQVPENISKSLIKSFKINGVTNITEGTVLIFSSEGSGVNVSVILREGSNEVCFPEEQLKQVSAGKATLMIILENTTTQKFSDKSFAFSKKIQYEKEIILNP